jgi:hypothetical protein
VKFVRHQEDRYPVDVLRRNDWLVTYQGYQATEVFRGLDHLVSFYGLNGTRAGFEGVYRIVGVRPASDGPTPTTCPWSKAWQRDCRFFYDFERDSRFDDFRDRVIIDWGLGARAWAQKPSNKPVLSMLEPGRVLPPFDDYLEFSLTYDHLCDLFAHEDAHQEWRAHLRAVGGVYLILAETTGGLYVGSASGEEGIWGRWREYAESGDGGNTRLRELIQRNPEYPKNFRFSVLQILPKTITRDRILQHETVYKEKLGSRAIGLNEN